MEDFFSHFLLKNQCKIDKFLNLGICLKNILGLKNIPPIVQISKSKHHSISTLNHKKKNHQKYGVVNLLHSLKVQKNKQPSDWPTLTTLQLIPPLKKNLTVEKSSALLRKNFFSKEKKNQNNKKYTKKKSTSSELLGAKINIYVARIWC